MKPGGPNGPRGPLAPMRPGSPGRIDIMVCTGLSSFFSKACCIPASSLSLFFSFKTGDACEYSCQ